MILYGYEIIRPARILFATEISLNSNVWQTLPY
jgi:hypothetical protein